MAQDKKNIYFYFEGAVAWKLHVPTEGRRTYYVETFGAEREFIGVAFFTPPEDADFHVMLDEGTIVVSYQLFP